MLTRRILLPAIAALAVASAAAAHSPQARHGGRIAHAGGYHVELVTRANTVEAFLIGHDDRAMAVDGYTGVALLVVDGKRQRIPLAPRDNRLVGEAGISLPDSVAGVVQITSPAGVTASAKFK